MVLLVERTEHGAGSLDAVVHIHLPPPRKKSKISATVDRPHETTLRLDLQNQFIHNYITLAPDLTQKLFLSEPGLVTRRPTFTSPYINTNLIQSNTTTFSFPSSSQSRIRASRSKMYPGECGSVHSGRYS